MLNSPTHSLEAIVFGVVVFLILYLIRRVRIWMLKDNNPTVDNSAVLFSYFSKGNDLFATKRRSLSGVEGGASSTTMVTMPIKRAALSEDEIAVASGKAIILVELPFKSKLHVLGITKNGGLDQLDPAGGTGMMERVVLEGDFSDYFSIFVDKGDDFQLRYVLDPEAMEYVVDFCKKYHWEIVDDTMYFAAKADIPKDEVIVEFIKKIRPAVVDKENVSKIEVTTKNDIWPRPSKYKCPVCEQAMQQYRHWYECPAGHGQLIQAGLLSDQETKDDFKSQGKVREGKAQQHQAINCPVCGSAMVSVPYAGSDININSCTSETCFYRWLDAGEFDKILARPKF